MRTLRDMLFKPLDSTERALGTLPELKAVLVHQAAEEHRRTLGTQLQALEAEERRGNPPLAAAAAAATAKREVAQAALSRATEEAVAADYAFISWRTSLYERTARTRQQLKDTAPPVLEEYAAALDRLRCTMREESVHAPAPGTRTNPYEKGWPKYYTPDPTARPCGTADKLLALRAEVEELALRPERNYEEALAEIARRAAALAGQPLDLTRARG